MGRNEEALKDRNEAEVAVFHLVQKWNGMGWYDLFIQKGMTKAVLHRAHQVGGHIDLSWPIWFCAKSFVEGGRGEFPWTNPFGVQAMPPSFVVQLDRERKG